MRRSQTRASLLASSASAVSVWGPPGGGPAAEVLAGPHQPHDELLALRGELGELHARRCKGEKGIPGGLAFPDGRFLAHRPPIAGTRGQLLLVFGRCAPEQRRPARSKRAVEGSPRWMRDQEVAHGETPSRVHSTGAALRSSYSAQEILADDACLGLSPFAACQRERESTEVQGRLSSRSASARLMTSVRPMFDSTE